MVEKLNAPKTMTNSANLQSIKDYLFIQFELSDDQVQEMLPTFVDTILSHMVDLEHEMNRKNVDSIRKMAHTLKGALLNLGLENLAHIAAEIEDFQGSEDEWERWCNQILLLRREMDSFFFTREL